MADVDHFKRINDEYGHITGDEVLVSVASILQENIRDLDYCFRWGGEEFIILLTGTEFEGAVIFAEKIRKAIESCTLFTAVPVTVSIGVASYREGWNQDLWIRSADLAMYQAKKLGRNRVEGKS